MTRHDAQHAERPTEPSHGTLTQGTFSGTLNRDGTASLHPDHATSSNERRASSINPKSNPSEPAVIDDDEDATGIDDFDDEKMENYDDLKVDPDTLISTRRSMDESYRRGTLSDAETSICSDSESVVNGIAGKENSIPIRLESTDKQGHYLLTADDPEIKEILRKGIEREEAEAGRSKVPRTRVRDLVFTRQFTTFDRRHAAAAESPFFGFFTLFWICMVLVFCQVAMKNWRDYGSILGRNQVMKLMFSRDVLVLGLTDGVMYAATFEGYFFQKLVRRGYISWAKSGWIIQNIWQTFYLAAVIGWAYHRQWPWTHMIFVTLHGLVFVMKQHSYAFYNGYLSGVYRRRALLERKLKQLEAIEPVRTGASRGAAKTSAVSHEVTNTARSTVERRPSMGPRTSTNFQTERSDVADVAEAISSGRPINADQMSTFSSIIRLEMDELNKELRGKSEDGKNAYPKNLDVSGFTQFAEYVCLPTLVYELEYPRQDKINWWYVLEKTTATFGVLCVMQVISQGYIYPPVAKTYRMKEAGMTLEQRWQEFPFIVSDMLFPLLIEQLLTWYLIWECILNVLAELTCFADRGFYGDWWNSTTFDQYARDWNRPVHNFLLRHVYHSSISTFHLSRTAATFVTFLLSALVHEMCMALIFSKVRGYLFWSQLLQLPMVALTRSKFMRKRIMLGNIIFWVGLFIGPSVLTSLYLVV
ncbi:unnamed protein product [Zymoseptoria tritici ST99CH_1A5]|uniref:O-acyltransferase n=4 Tax=Zymoseptoria tritici TaxID=1047171 RepID=A0A1X7RWR5_ZYMT9|nr:unnamed protein product [Zymoseptoria tritici ST99CH_3D7]SMR53950.1 unnamed protein product [Zymoseptoria tritici ST99CH_1E4]SMR56157.1 unnamed protein product [Zymoseptoria tritici ST99CH_3D1]SMY25340.1 unnamed protein product [Zymoseptoria tritici ST99CH_1A5]